MDTGLSEITTEVNRAMFLICGVSLVMLVGITAAMIYFVVRFRRDKTKTTRQIEGHTLLEITWIVAPTLIVTWMFFVGYEGFTLMRQAPDDAMEINVTAKRWAWSFNYPDDNVDAGELAVPVNTPVKLNLHVPVDDVLHSFYLPDFRVKEDVVPGLDTWLWFESQRTGIFNVFCAEFCGKDHAKMITTLHVLSEEDYRGWLRKKIEDKYRPLEFAAIDDPSHPAFGTEDLNIDVEGLYKTYCLSCHGAAGDGSGLPKEARDFRANKDWKKSPKVADIYRTLMQGVPDSQMRSYPNFTPYEKVALSHYVRQFMTDAPKTTAEDYAILVEEYGLDKVQAPKESIPIEKAMDLLIEEQK
jgi:cytochrome c oxidase subunit II